MWGGWGVGVGPGVDVGMGMREIFSLQGLAPHTCIMLDKVCVCECTWV